jgi:hypothetical protein
MRRIAHLTKLTSSVTDNEELTSDVHRAAVVFLYATFEDFFREQLPKTNIRGFYSQADLDKGFKKADVDPTPFKPLFRRLLNLAKKRSAIVHEADLSKDGTPHKWTMIDTYVLAMWNLAVLQFYYQMRVAKGLACKVETKMLSKVQKATERASAAGMQLIQFAKAEPGDQRAILDRVLEEFDATLSAISVTVEEFLTPEELEEYNASKKKDAT